MQLLSNITDSRRGTIVAVASAAIAFVIVAFTHEYTNALTPLLYLPLILSVVRCRFVTTVLLGVVLGLLNLVLAYLKPPKPVTVPELHIVASALQSLIVVLVAVIGGFYARRVRSEQRKLRTGLEQGKLLLEVSGHISAANSLDEAQNAALDFIQTVVPGLRMCAIFLADESQRSLSLKALKTIDDVKIGLERVSFVNAPRLDPQSNAEPVISDIHDRIEPTLQFMDPEAQCAVWIGIRSGNVASGALFVTTSEKPLSRTQLHFLQEFANQIGYPLYRLQVQEGLQIQAYNDPMTGLFNFRAFKENLEEELKRSHRYGHKLSIVIFDIDGFKLVNDGYGHPVGNRIVAEVAAILRQNVRETDLPARYGGDEFVVICPETESQSAMVLAERVRKAVAGFQFHATKNESFKLTCSAGIAAYPEHAEREETLMEAADAALYTAKRLGRNRSVCAESTSGEINQSDLNLT